MRKLRPGRQGQLVESWRPACARGRRDDCDPTPNHHVWFVGAKCPAALPSGAGPSVHHPFQLKLGRRCRKDGLHMQNVRLPELGQNSHPQPSWRQEAPSVAFFLTTRSLWSRTGGAGCLSAGHCAVASWGRKAKGEVVPFYDLFFIASLFLPFVSFCNEKSFSKPKVNESHSYLETVSF